MWSVTMFVLAVATVAQCKWIVRDRSGTPVLEVLYQEDTREVYRDERTLAWEYLAVHEPNPVPGFFMLGHKAQGDWEEMRGNIIMVKDLVGDLDQRYLVQPTDLEEVWRDEGGFGVQDVAFWRPICPAGSYSLGDIAYACEWCGWPKPLSYLGQIKCVTDEVADRCRISPAPLWTNFGGFENQLGSVWEVNAVTDAGITTFWKGNQGHDIPPTNGRSYCLNAPERVPDEEI